MKFWTFKSILHYFTAGICPKVVFFGGNSRVTLVTKSKIFEDENVQIYLIVKSFYYDR
jgi:hypothetical protein